MHCPHCQTTLIEIPTRQSPQIDVCPNKHGLWLDTGEMTLFLENDRTFSSSASAGAALVVQTSSICPRCHTLLDEHVVSGEGAFTCPGCQGWWLPQGVLTRLHGAHRGGLAAIQLDEISLYARAVAAQSKRDQRAARQRRMRQSSSIGLLYWVTIVVIVSLVITLLIAESFRRIVAKGHGLGKLDAGLALLAVGMVGGITVFFYGVGLHRRKHLIETTPTSAIRSLAIGLVEITGKAGPSGAMLNAPFSGMPCVFFSYKVEERQRSGKQNKWVTIAKGHSHLPFTVHDGTAAVTIMPIGAELMIETRGTYQNGGHIGLPITVEAGLAALGVTSSGWLSSKTLRCTESFILPEEKVYILGTAQEGDQDQSANEARLFIGTHPDGVFMIADQSERDLLSGLQWKALVLLYGGPALTAACVWGLLHASAAAIPYP
jgi:Zn-finger nucleic acid-binding protein